ncbi:hypothetical protein Y046_6319 [Burkholderia pseudomallei MSHR2990]|nr:hypothetical protein Y046_6319 [Burkholderia pseudomallei MSHR2990]
MNVDYFLSILASDKIHSNPIVHKVITLRQRVPPEKKISKTLFRLKRIPVNHSLAKTPIPGSASQHLHHSKPHRAAARAML